MTKQLEYRADEDGGSWCADDGATSAHHSSVDDALVHIRVVVGRRCIADLERVACFIEAAGGAITFSRVNDGDWCVDGSFLEEWIGGTLTAAARHAAGAAVDLAAHMVGELCTNVLKGSRR